MMNNDDRNELLRIAHAAALTGAAHAVRTRLAQMKSRDGGGPSDAETHKATARDVLDIVASVVSLEVPTTR